MIIKKFNIWENLEIYKASHISDIINEQLLDNNNQLYQLAFK